MTKTINWAPTNLQFIMSHVKDKSSHNSWTLESFVLCQGRLQVKTVTRVVSLYVLVVNSISQTAGRSMCNQCVSGITLRQTQSIHLSVVMGQLSTDYFVQENALNDSIMTQERLSVTGERTDCSHELLDNEKSAGAAGGPSSTWVVIFFLCMWRWKCDFSSISSVNTTGKIWKQQVITLNR